MDRIFLTNGKGLVASVLQWGFHVMRDISWQAEKWLASQEGMRSMEYCDFIGLWKWHNPNTWEALLDRLRLK
jgi:hypothetical protein